MAERTGSCPPSRVGGDKCHRVSAKTQRISAGIQETAREGPQAAGPPSHQKSKWSSASLWLRQANLSHTFPGNPAERWMSAHPRDFWVPKEAASWPGAAPKLRDHPAFPCLAWGSPPAALAQGGSLPCLVGFGFSQAGLSFSRSGLKLLQNPISIHRIFFLKG